MLKIFEVQLQMGIVTLIGGTCRRSQGLLDKAFYQHGFAMTMHNLSDRSVQLNVVFDTCDTTYTRRHIRVS